MCEFYVKADPIQYEQRSRSIRIRGVLTTIRLENSFWDILAEMAEEEGCSTNSLITKFHEEILAYRGEVPNFASFLRVTCIRYLRRGMIELEKKLDSFQDVLYEDAANTILEEDERANGTYNNAKNFSNITTFKR
jgi:predicted DNA-binding ribbon-helix-helix protein